MGRGRAITRELQRYCDEQERLQTERLRRANPELFALEKQEPGSDDDAMDYANDCPDDHPEVL